MTSQEVLKTMRALLYDRPARSLRLVQQWPVPEPDFASDEHLLKVECIAITKDELTWEFPPESYKDYSPGVEMSGTVVASPPGSKFPPGSRIYMRTTAPRSASAREYTIGLGKELARQPRNFSPEEAASVPVSALTAWQALFLKARFPSRFDEPHHQSLSELPKKKILIIGASGSVGLWTTQLACAAGFWVVGTCHTRNVKLVQTLGTHEVIDYTKTSVGAWLENTKSAGKFDLVLDCVSSKSSIDAWHAANPEGGLVLSIVAPEDGTFRWMLDRPEGISPKVKGRFFIMESNGEQLQKITDLIETRKLQAVVDSVFDLDEYREAFDRVDSGMATGKVVVRVQPKKHQSPL